MRIPKRVLKTSGWKFWFEERQLYGFKKHRESQIAKLVAEKQTQENLFKEPRENDTSDTGEPPVIREMADFSS